jgi:hypothetical protein
MTRNANVILAATLLLTSACAPPCKAQMSPEDRALAAQSGLAESDIQAIRRAVGVPVLETPQAAAPRPPMGVRRIVSIDATSLKPNDGHVLVVVQTAGCVAIHVMKRDAKGFAEVWSLGKMPSGGFTATGSDGICSLASAAPSAHGTADGRIVIEVPVRTDPFQRTTPSQFYSFAWDGKTYRQQGDQMPAGYRPRPATD